MMMEQAEEAMLHAALPSRINGFPSRAAPISSWAHDAPGRIDLEHGIAIGHCAIERRSRL